jgi:hypothetical protein
MYEITPNQDADNNDDGNTHQYPLVPMCRYTGLLATVGFRKYSWKHLLKGFSALSSHNLITSGHHKSSVSPVPISVMGTGKNQL